MGTEEVDRILQIGGIANWWAGVLIREKQGGFRCPRGILGASLRGMNLSHDEQDEFWDTVLDRQAEWVMERAKLDRDPSFHWHTGSCLACSCEDPPDPPEEPGWGSLFSSQ